MRKNSRQLEMDWPGVFLLMLAHGQQNKFSYEIPGTMANFRVPYDIYSFLYPYHELCRRILGHLRVLEKLFRSRYPKGYISRP